eukprot:121679-Pleurochrysis_carterae.AAC.2
MCAATYQGTSTETLVARTERLRLHAADAQVIACTLRALASRFNPEADNADADADADANSCADLEPNYDDGDVGPRSPLAAGRGASHMGVDGRASAGLKLLRPAGMRTPRVVKASASISSCSVSSVGSATDEPACDSRAESRTESRVSQSSVAEGRPSYGLRI